MNIDNIILNADSYKVGGHWQQYPKGTTEIFSYIESRGCNYTDNIMMFGLQYFIKKYLSKPITQKDIDEAETIVTAHGLPFNRKGWEYILNNHNGYLPVKIKSLKEGAVVKTHNVMLTIENTDPECFWLTSYLETCLLRAVYYPSTVASNSFYVKKLIYNALKESSETPEAELPFKFHDFGFRGVSTFESAGIGGLAHIVNFSGTDTLAALVYAKEYYDSEVCAYSIPASEHSTMTSWTREHELDAYSNMVEQYAHEGKIFACVIDSYSTFNAIDLWYENGLFDKVKERKATVVMRPDSGDPTTMPIEVIKYLMDKVGYEINTKGYKVLPAHIRVIQGDGINLKSIKTILDNMLKEKLSISNLAFGCGAGLLQQVDRDSYKMAMKCSSAKINGEYVDVYKDPITDSGKRSKKGRITLVAEGDEIVTKRIEEVNAGDIELLQVIYDNKPIENAYESFNKIRERSNKFLNKS